MDHNNCPILALPPELRLHIYNYVYDSPSTKPCTFTILENGRIETSSLPALKWAGAASLLRTCKQINAEATPFLYAEAKFHISLYGHDDDAPPMMDYGTTRDCLTFRDIRHLTLSLHVPFGDKVGQSVLDRLPATLRLLDAERALESCSVRVFLHWNPSSDDAEVALAVLRRILELERTSVLNLVECQVYTQLWKEAVRVGRRGSIEYVSHMKFREHLKTVHAGEERQVGNTGRAYDLR